MATEFLPGDLLYRQYLADIEKFTMTALTEPERFVPADLFHFADLIARRMVTGAAVRNARSWRAAARKSTRSRTIYELLKKDLHGNLGLEQIINRNAAFISTVPGDVARRLTGYIAEQQQKGLRASEIQKQLQRNLPDIARNRLKLIARTEVGKASTAVTQVRAQALGLNWYEWQSSDDQRVRKSHKNMNGVLVSWSEPPAPEALVGEKSTLGHYQAAECPNCRCLALPLVRLDEVRWPHRVYSGGAIRSMSRSEFERLNGVRRAA